MGTNNFETKNPGDVISSDDPNQYKTGLTNDHVPRNTAGQPTDQGGSLGSTIYRWLNAYITKLFIGATASGLSIEEDGGELIFNVGGVEVVRMDANGLTSNSFPDTGVLPQLKRVRFTSSGSFNVPNDVSNIMLWGAGAGGGGGGGGAADTTAGVGSGHGGQGGGGVQPFLLMKPVTPGGTISVTIGGGGAGGAGQLNGVAATDGAAGGSTTTSGAGQTSDFDGGPGGEGDSTSNPGFGWEGKRQIMYGGGGGQNSGGGSGNTGSTGANGSGGSGGSGGSPNGGGGGGGGSGFSSGGAGGNGVNSGTPTAGGDGGTCAGGAGGGGNGDPSSGSDGADGGDGGDGILEIYYVSHL